LGFSLIPAVIVAASLIFTRSYGLTASRLEELIAAAPPTVAMEVMTK
jgi:hypothetical protein